MPPIRIATNPRNAKTNRDNLLNFKIASNPMRLNGLYMFRLRSLQRHVSLILLNKFRKKEASLSFKRESLQEREPFYESLLQLLDRTSLSLVGEIVKEISKIFIKITNYYVLRVLTFWTSLSLLKINFQIPDQKLPEKVLRIFCSY